MVKTLRAPQAPPRVRFVLLPFDGTLVRVSRILTDHTVQPSQQILSAGVVCWVTWSKFHVESHRQTAPRESRVDVEFLVFCNSSEARCRRKYRYLPWRKVHLLFSSAWIYCKSNLIFTSTVDEIKSAVGFDNGVVMRKSREDSAVALRCHVHMLRDIPCILPFNV